MAKPTCVVCYRQTVDPSTSQEPHVAFRMMCTGCLAKFDIWSTANEALAQRERAKEAPPYTDEDRNTLVSGTMWMARVKEGKHAYADWERNQQRPGKPPNPATEWLRQQDPMRGKQVLYRGWLEVDKSRDSPKNRKRFNEVWRRLFGADK